MKLSVFSFATPGFWEGMARVVDLGGTLVEYNAFLLSGMEDMLAIGTDWLAIGEDMRAAINQVIKDYEKQKDKEFSDG